MVDLHRLIIAVVVLIVVYATCFAVFAHWALFRLGVLKRGPFSGGPPSRVIRKAFLVLGALGLLCFGWAFIEPYFPRTEATRIPSPKITRPVRIVHLTDLHCDATERAEEAVVEMTRALTPDLILFTGDGINSDEGIPLFRRTTRALAEIAPLYGVRGNWEVWWFKRENPFRGSGLRALNGEAVPIVVAGQPLWLAGVAVDHEGRMGRMLKRMPKDAFRIVMHHFPAAVRRVDGRADLLLSGDTHGGQLCLPFVGPLIRIARWDRRFYAAGLHRTRRGLWHYVNRGVGMEGGDVPRVRFNCPPEVALIELVPE